MSLRRVAVPLALALAVCGCRNLSRDASGRATPPSDGLVAHWRFDEGGGEELHDVSGKRYDGTIHGAIWVKAGKGQALAFSGKDSYVDCGDVPQLKPTGDVSFSAWIRLEAQPYPDAGTKGGAGPRSPDRVHPQGERQGRARLDQPRGARAALLRVAGGLLGV